MNSFARTLTRAAVAVLLAATIAAPATAGESKPKRELTSVSIVEMPLPEDCWSTRPAGAVIDSIVIHYCSDVMANPDKPFEPERIHKIFSGAHVSSHYFVARDGTIYRFVAEKDKAWHAGKGELPWDPQGKDQMNNHSIGIETAAIGSAEDMKIFMSAERYKDLATSHPENIGYTDAQYDALNRLIGGIIERNPAITRDRRHIIGHEEWSGRARKTDPGELFDWARLALPRDFPKDAATTASAPKAWSVAEHYKMRCGQIREAIAKLPEGTTGTVVLLGDSITEGHPARTVAGMTVVNEGISGDRAVVADPPIGVLRRLDLVTSAKPAMVFLMIGINDFGEKETCDQLEAEYRELLPALRAAAPNARIFVQSILPTRDHFAFHIPNVREMNGRIQRMCLEEGMDWVDLTTAVADPDGLLKAHYTGDGLHLKPPGYAVWQTILEDKAKAAIAEGAKEAAKQPATPTTGRRKAGKRP